MTQHDSLPNTVLQAMLANAVAAQRDGNLDQADAIARALLDLAPAHAEALTLRATLALRRLDPATAAALAEAAAAADPADPQPRHVLGLACRLLGRPDLALDAFRDAIRLRPDWAEPHHGLGLTLHELARTDDAVAALTEAVRLKPETALTHFHLGTALADLGRGEAAVAAFREALARDPDFAEAHNNLGTALLDLGHHDEAAAAFRAAIALKPDFAEAHNNLGNAETLREDDHAAIAAYATAIQLHPDLPQPHHNLGNALRRVGRPLDALCAFDAAIGLKPDYAEAHGARGAALRDLRRFDEAIESYRQAALLDPAYQMPRLHLALMLVRAGRVREAIDLLGDQIEDQRGGEDRDDLFRALMFCAANHDGPDDGVGRLLAEAFAAEFGGHGPLAPRVPATPAEAERRLRIGYLTSDLRRHPVAINLIPAVRSHDRTRFSLHFYSLDQREDLFTDWFRPFADGWTLVAGLDNETIARRIAADGIDILVVLASRFDLNRPGIAGWRPAPVQISLYDVGTTGLAEMDYILADRWLIPPGHPEYFSERPLRLPQYYVVDLPDILPLPTRPRSGPPVFCCFNSPAKIGPATLAVWGRLLAARRDARLILKYMQNYASDGLRERIFAGLAAAGAHPDQVVFCTEQDTAEAFIARYNDADFALDPFPFSGSTTSFQSLAMGVPVITWPWPRMVSRWTTAMLSRLGLDQMIASSAEDYIARALAACDQVEQWRGRRMELRAAVAASPLVAGERWTRHLERLYRAVWRRHVLGERRW
ncbi:tetratricopeptide repeat protein [Phaeospirillum tilakii]|uniref:protein O-GlcNAc transferase n=1 Tax=Phaeospirillum tilakii TaxID=741673 RepID=A0ABW5C958_9PROT